MRLSQLLHSIYPVPTAMDPTITGLSQDSRSLETGYLFFAYRGLRYDGKHFIPQALAKGAAAILTELAVPEQIGSTIPILTIPNLTAYMGLIAARFYAYPSHHLQVVGFTGSNGKTSCSHFLAHCLTQLHHSCALIGTLGYGLYDQLRLGLLTTPDAIELHALLADFLQKKVDYVSMEVSSHRLAQKRLNGMEFSVAVFTNLTRDHLDYHQTMQAYAAAKRSLFSLPVAHSVLNADDSVAENWLIPLYWEQSVYAYSLHPPQKHLAKIPHVYARNFSCTAQGIGAQVSTPWGEADFYNAHLLGSFNLSNSLAVLTALLLLNIPLKEAIHYLSQVRSSRGRMECFGGGVLPQIIIDYAHTPDALAQVLQTVRSLCRGRVICVFGCGGDRDQGKRPLMGALAERYADRVILTDDNPRTEDPQKIMADILKGFKQPKKVSVIHQRSEAIKTSLQCADVDDLVLIAGKGHETYQLVADRAQTCSDHAIVKTWLATV